MGLHVPHYRPKENLADTILFVAVVVFLVLVAGLMSGLTLGLLSLSKTDLEVFLRSGTPVEKKRAARIEPVLKRPHFLLVTLVLCNAAATEALPIFLDRLLDPITAVIISIVVVLIFGEIIPQAVCTRYGLAVGAYSASTVQVLMWLCFGIAYPISKILDFVLGSEHDALFRRPQLKALVSLHSKEEGLGGTLTSDEISIIRGALDLSSKNASACMTPLDKVFMLSSEDVLDEDRLLRILDSGHSRIPVHRPGRREDIVGLLLVKELIIVDKSAGIKAGEVRMRGLPYLQANTSLYELLHLFESGRCHMAVLVEPLPDTPDSVTAEEQLEEVIHVRIENEHVESEPVVGRCTSMGSGSESDPAPTVLGIVTIEDIFEELIQAEIIDETDRFVDNEGMERVNAGLLLKQLPPHLRSLVRSRQFLPRVGPYKMHARDHSRELMVDRALENARAEAARRGAEGSSRRPARMRPGTPKRPRLTSRSEDGGRSRQEWREEEEEITGQAYNRDHDKQDLRRPLLHNADADL